MCQSGDGWVQWTAGCSEVPKPRLLTHPFDQVKTYFGLPNHTSIRSPERLTITLSNNKSFWFPQQGSVPNFQPNTLSDPLFWVKSINSNQPYFQISQLGSIYNFQPDILPYHSVMVHSNFLQETSMTRPKLTPIFRPSKILLQYPSYTPLTKNTPR